MSETKVFDFLYLLFPTLASIAGGPLPFSWIDGIVNVRRNGVLLSSKIERRHIIGEKVWHSFSIGNDSNAYLSYQDVLAMATLDTVCYLCLLGEEATRRLIRPLARFGQKC